MGHLVHMCRTNLERIEALGESGRSRMFTSSLWKLRQAPRGLYAACVTVKNLRGLQDVRGQQRDRGDLNAVLYGLYPL